MVKYGPERSFKCTHCDVTLSHRAILEVNGCQVMVWSDGYFDSPSAPEPPLVVKCSGCKGIIWLPEVEIDLASGDGGQAYLNLDAEEYWQLLKQYESSVSEHLLYVRLKCWQTSNHKYRQSMEETPKLSLREVKNLEGILALINLDSQSECNIAIEVLRHLSRFKEALIFIEQQGYKLDHQLIAAQNKLIRGYKTNVFPCSFSGER